MHMYLRTILVLALAGCSGEWKPSGDGKTIVHTRTGEIRMTATGETVEEYNGRRAEEQLAEKTAQSIKNAEAQAAQQRQSKIHAAITNEALAAANEARLKALHENGNHYHAIQVLVCDTSMEQVKPHYGEWWACTKSFREDRFPGLSERDQGNRI